MTDPERISRRGGGLAAQLLRSVADEEPSGASVQRTLVALGVSGAVLTTASVAGATVGTSGVTLASAVSAGAGAGATVSAGATKTATALLLVKWVGAGVVGGLGLAGAAAAVSAPAVAPPVAASVHVAKRPLPPVVGRSRTVAIAPRSTDVSESKTESPAPSPRPTPSMNTRAPTPEPPLDVGALLAAEVAFVDQARTLLGAGRSEAALSQLSRYEREFPEARLLPEVLFLQLEAYERLGRASGARRVAERLVSAFPKSPHAARARALLDQRFP